MLHLRVILILSTAEEGILLVKGISRRVIVVESPDPHIFEQAIFILSNDAATNSGVTSQQLVDQAVRIAKSYARTHDDLPKSHFRVTPWLAALLGGAAISLVWLLVVLL